MGSINDSAPAGPHAARQALLTSFNAVMQQQGKSVRVLLLVRCRLCEHGRIARTAGASQHGGLDACPHCPDGSRGSGRRRSCTQRECAGLEVRGEAYVCAHGLAARPILSRSLVRLRAALQSTPGLPDHGASCIRAQLLPMPRCWGPNRVHRCPLPPLPRVLRRPTGPSCSARWTAWGRSGQRP